MGREVHAYTELKSEVAGMKQTVTTMEDNFKRATAEQMTFVRQATKQLVDLSAAHARLEEMVDARGGSARAVGSRNAAAIEALSMDGINHRGGGGGGGEAVEGGESRGSTVGAGAGAGGRQQRGGQQRRAGHTTDSGGNGNVRGGGGRTSSDDGLWETSGSEAKAAGGLAKNVKEGDLPWDN